MSDACWLAPGSDPRIVMRPLFERSELARAPKVRVSVPSDVVRQGDNVYGASRRARPLLGTFPSTTKVAPFGMP